MRTVVAQVLDMNRGRGRGRGGFRGGRGGRDGDHVGAPRQQEGPMIEVKEEECGIHGFANPDVPGFFGILKQRYRRFCVIVMTNCGQIHRFHRE